MTPESRWATVRATLAVLGTRRQWVQLAVRSVLVAGLILGIAHEAGPWTATFATLMWLGSEALAIALRALV